MVNAGNGTKDGIFAPQDPGTMNWLSKLSTIWALKRVSKGVGVGTSPIAARKNASCRASALRIEAGPCTILASDSARPEIRLMTPPMPTLVMTLARLKNSAALETGKLYWHLSNVVALLACRIPLAVAT